MAEVREKKPSVLKRATAFSLGPETLTSPQALTRPRSPHLLGPLPSANLSFSDSLNTVLARPSTAATRGYGHPKDSPFLPWPGARAAKAGTQGSCGDTTDSRHQDLAPIATFATRVGTSQEVPALGPGIQSGRAGDESLTSLRLALWPSRHLRGRHELARPALDPYLARGEGGGSHSKTHRWTHRRNTTPLPGRSRLLEVHGLRDLGPLLVAEETEARAPRPKVIQKAAAGRGRAGLPPATFPDPGTSLPASVPRDPARAPSNRPWGAQALGSSAVLTSRRPGQGERRIQDLGPRPGRAPAEVPAERGSQDPRVRQEMPLA